MIRSCYITFRDVEIYVSYTYYPPSRGARERGTGVQLEPDEPASVDIEELFIGDVDVTELLIEDFAEDLERLVIEEGRE